LRARRVELSAALRDSELQRDELVAEKVLAGGKVRWERDVGGFTSHDVGLVPGRVTGLESKLADLEPLRVRGVVRRALAIALGKVCHDRTDIVRPIVSTRGTANPLNQNVAAGIGVSGLGGKLGILAAVQVRVRSTLDGVDRRYLTNSTGRGILARHIAFIDSPIDGDLGDVAVGSDRVDESEERESEVENVDHVWCAVERET